MFERLARNNITLAQPDMPLESVRHGARSSGSLPRGPLFQILSITRQVVPKTGGILYGDRIFASTDFLEGDMLRWTKW